MLHVLDDRRIALFTAGEGQFWNMVESEFMFHGGNMHIAVKRSNSIARWRLRTEVTFRRLILDSRENDPDFTGIGRLDRTLTLTNYYD